MKKIFEWEYKLPKFERYLFLWFSLLCGISLFSQVVCKALVADISKVKLVWSCWLRVSQVHFHRKHLELSNYITPQSHINPTQKKQSKVINQLTSMYAVAFRLIPFSLWLVFHRMVLTVSSLLYSYVIPTHSQNLCGEKERKKYIIRKHCIEYKGDE